MAPGAQTVGDFISDRMSNGYKVISLGERRRLIRESADYTRYHPTSRPSSRRPSSRRTLHRDSSSSTHRTSSAFGNRHMSNEYHHDDRWDTDTEQLDDRSSLELGTMTLLSQPLKSFESGHVQEYPPSPVVDQFTQSEPSNTEEEDDQNSPAVTTPAKSERYGQSISNSPPPKTLNAMYANYPGPDPAINSTNPMATLPDHVDGHSSYEDDSHEPKVVIASATKVAFPSRVSSNLSLRTRTREASAPPTISPRQTFSPVAQRGPVAGVTSMPYEHGTPPIDEDAEYEDGGSINRARMVSIHHSHSVSNLSMTSIGSGDLRGPRNKFRTKRSHVSLRRQRHPQLEMGLDYTAAELKNMDYQKLAEEDFDYDPLQKNSTSPVPDLESKCDHFRKLKHNAPPEAPDGSGKGAQERFFASLSITDYEECGDIIVGQLAGLIDRMRQVRQAKRKAARELEHEVAKREAVVNARREALQQELAQLKRTGQQALAAAVATQSSS